MKTYYHWIQDGIDFITLDNASPDEFDAEQMKWLQKLLKRDREAPEIRAVVVGMHEALPESLAASHSMEQFPVSLESGRKVYEWLLELEQRSKKPVYVLASHSHFYMEDVYNSEYWREHGGVLRGWIIGTAGAVRYKLPDDAKQAKAAKTNVYGYLVATVTASKTDPIHFEFEQLEESNVPPAVVSRFTSALVHSCWTGNSQAE